PPVMLYLQVIFAIGASMVILSALIWLPVSVVAAFGIIVIAGHNLLTPINFTPDSGWYIPWAFIHDRSVVEISEHFKFRTSYQIIPWVGIMALGYAVGRSFLPSVSRDSRRQA